MEDINSRKAFYERTLGIELKSVEFHEGEIRPLPTRSANRLEEVIVQRVRGSASTSKMREAGDFQTSAVPAFDEIGYTATVSLSVGRRQANSNSASFGRLGLSEDPLIPIRRPSAASACRKTR